MQAKLQAIAAAEPVWARLPRHAAPGIAIALVALALLPLVTHDSHVHHVLITIFIYAVMAQSWRLMAGFAGMYSLGHAAFFGLGAYASGVLFTKFGISPWFGGLAGMALSSAWAAIIGLPILRLRSHYFSIATLLMASCLQLFFLRWDDVGAASGLYLPIQRENPWWDMQFHTSKLPYYYIALAVLCACTALIWKLGRSRWGLRLQALRDEPDAAASLGIHVGRHRIVVFMLSAAMMSLAGTLYAQYVMVVDAERVFSAELSTLALLMAVLGGVNTTLGPVLGAAILVPLSEYSRVWWGGTGRSIDLFIYGVLIMAVTLYRPAGLMSLIGEKVQRRGTP